MVNIENYKSLSQITEIRTELAKGAINHLKIRKYFIYIKTDVYLR